jgi:hypothetical protein
MVNRNERKTEQKLRYSLLGWYAEYPKTTYEEKIG